MLIITLVTKPFGWVHPHKHQHGTILYTYYTVSSYFQPAQAYDMNSTHVRLMSFTLAALLLLWVTGKAETLCLQTVHQMLSHLWLFKMEPSRLLPICQCSCKSNGKDATVCGSTLHLSVHVLYGMMPGLGVASRAAIWFIKCDVGAGGRLS